MSPPDELISPIRNPGWKVVFAGLGINLVLGLLYSWSVISKNIPADWHWTEANRSLPYSTACVALALAMFPAGRLQDLVGPRFVALTGGILVAAGMVIASLANTPLNYALGYGLFVGVGMGFGYSATTPPAIKWFPAARVGMVAGIVVAGFGLASVYLAPLTEFSIRAIGLPHTLLCFGLGVLAVVCLLAHWLQIPPVGYVPPGSLAPVPAEANNKIDFKPSEVLRTPQFYALWFMYACSSGAGLMVISKLAKIVSDQAGLQLGFALVACLGVGNGAGRVLGGLTSDKIGRRATMRLVFIFQAILILLLSHAHSDNFLGFTAVLVVLSFLIGANYGSTAALFPSATKDFYGLKNFGANYGLVFTSWGTGGFTLSYLAGHVYDQTHSFAFAYYCSAGLLIVAAAITFFLVPPKPRPHS